MDYNSEQERFFRNLGQSYDGLATIVVVLMGLLGVWILGVVICALFFMSPPP